MDRTVWTRASLLGVSPMPRPEPTGSGALRIPIWARRAPRSGRDRPQLAHQAEQLPHALPARGQPRHRAVIHHVGHQQLLQCRGVPTGLVLVDEPPDHLLVPLLLLAHFGLLSPLGPLARGWRGGQARGIGRTTNLLPALRLKPRGLRGGGAPWRTWPLPRGWTPRSSRRCPARGARRCAGTRAGAPRCRGWR